MKFVYQTSTGIFGCHILFSINSDPLERVECKVDSQATNNSLSHVKFLFKYENVHVCGLLF